MRLKGQVYIITTFVFLSFIFYALYFNNAPIQHISKEKLVLSKLEDLLYSSYNTSCKNLGVIFNMTEGYIEWGYLVFQGISYTKCDIYHLFDNIQIKEGRYIIEVGNKNLQFPINDSKTYIVVVKKDKLYIDVGTLK